MTIFQTYALSTAAWLTVQAVPLLAAPSLLVTLCVAEPRRITALETYLARALALALLAFAVQIAAQTGVIPVGTGADRRGAATADEDEGPAAVQDPHDHATLVVATVYHAAAAVYLYVQLAGGWNMGFGSGMVVSSGLACMGVWALLFGNERARISRRTGADKRTGNFPFANAESAREKKREEKGKRRSVKTDL